jgi:uncharacterized membrane protein YuzA (DUF378 family)
MGLLALAAMVLGPMIGAFMGLDGAVVVMILIIVIGIAAVVFVMMIGLIEDEHPHRAEESAAVQAWSKRLAEQSSAQNHAETSAEG